MKSITKHWIVQFKVRIAQGWHFLLKVSSILIFLQRRQWSWALVWVAEGPVAEGLFSSHRTLGSATKFVPSLTYFRGNFARKNRPLLTNFRLLLTFYLYDNFSQIWRIFEVLLYVKIDQIWRIFDPPPNFVRENRPNLTDFRPPLLCTWKTAKFDGFSRVFYAVLRSKPIFGDLVNLLTINKNTRNNPREKSFRVSELIVQKPPIRYQEANNLL